MARQTAGEPVPFVVPLTDARGRGRRVVIRLDSSIHVPPYEQLRAQLAVMINVGQLEPGTRLPSVRDLAAALGLAPGTVARTYRELEVGGLVEGRGRNGTVVVDDPPGSEPAEERRRRLAAAADTFAITARQLGVRRDVALAAVDAALAAHDARTHDPDAPES